MATSFGAYARCLETYDPVNDPRAPWDRFVYVCGLRAARTKAARLLCPDHGHEHAKDCDSCDRHATAVRAELRCGARWIGGDTCYYCQPSHVMEVILPTKAYLEYNDFDMRRVPNAVWDAWRTLDEKRRAE